VHWLAKEPGAPAASTARAAEPPPPVPVRRVAPRTAPLLVEGLRAREEPQPADEPVDEGLAAAPAADWRAEADAKLGEVSELRGERQVQAYLDTLLAQARQRGAVTPVETTVGREAVRSLADLSGAERDRMLNDYQERLLGLQAELQGTAPPATTADDDPRAADRLLAELKKGGQAPEARAELRQDLMNAVRALPPQEREKKLAEVHEALAGERGN